MHDQGPGQADVTEGSNGVWERLHYDWSNPRRITMMTTDSNLWGRRSGHTYTLTPRPDGTTDVDAVVVREGKNLKGRLFEILLATGGKRVLGKALATTVKAIESPELPERQGTHEPGREPRLRRVRQRPAATGRVSSQRRAEAVLSDGQHADLRQPRTRCSPIPG